MGEKEEKKLQKEKEKQEKKEEKNKKPGFFQKKYNKLKSFVIGGSKTPSIEAQTVPPSQVLSNDKREGLKNEYSDCTSYVEFLAKRDNKHNCGNELEKINNWKERLDKDSLNDAELNSYSSTLGNKIEEIEPSVNSAVGAKEELVTNVKENPIVTNMILHVGKVGQENRVRSKAIANKRLEAEEYFGGKIEDEKQRKKRLFQLKMEERRKDEMPETWAEKANREREEKISNGEDKGIGFIAKIIEIYNGILGNQTDIMDTTSLSDIKEDLVDNYSKLSAGGLEPGVSDYLGAVGAYLSIINVTIDMIRNFANGMETKGLQDNQEKNLDRRILITNIVSLISSSIDFCSMFTDMVPFLGVILNLAQDGMDLGITIMERANTHKRSGQIDNAKKRLSARLEQKREEHKNDGMKLLFDVDVSKDENIYKKRNELMGIISQTEGTEADKQVGEHSVYKPQNIATRTINWLDTSVHRKDKQVLDQGYGEVNERLSRNQAKLLRKEASGKELSPKDKISMAQLEALEILNEYQVLNATEHRMKLKKGSEIEDLVKSSIKIASDGLILAGQITTATGVAAPVGAGLILGGKIGKAAVGLLNTSEMAAGLLNQQFESHSQRGKNKGFQRNEMAVALFERMDMIAKHNKDHGWLNNPDSIKATTKDRDIQRVNNDYGYILAYRQGSDMRVSSILSANSRNDIISSLSATFSQDGN